MSDQPSKQDAELAKAELDKVTGGAEIKPGPAPSTGVGTSTATSASRQTTNDSFASKIVGGAG